MRHISSETHMMGTVSLLALRGLFKTDKYLTRRKSDFRWIREFMRMHQKPSKLIKNTRVISQILFEEEKPNSGY